MRYSLKAGERVLLHLSQYPRMAEGGAYPPEVSQQGISSATKVQRKHLPRVLRELINAGLIKEEKGRIHGAKQRLKIYTITERGADEARKILTPMRDVQVSIQTPDGRIGCKLSEVKNYLGGHTDAYWAILLKDDGTIEPPGSSHDEDERIVTYKKALISVMSDGVITQVEEEMLSHLRKMLALTEEEAERVYQELLGKEKIEPPVRLDVYKDVLRQIIDDTVISEDEQRVLSALRKKLGITEELHETLLQSLMKEAEILSIKEKLAVEDVLLIYNDGRLIAHLSRRKKISVDSDLIAGMLTAVQSFMDDVYRGAETGDIEELKYGGYFFSIETGRYVSLAASSKERLSAYTRRKIRDLLTRIESRFESLLTRWDGNIGSMAQLIESVKEEFGIQE